MSTTYGTIPTSPDDAGSKVEFLSRTTERIQTSLNTRRPWKEMFNPHSISLPQAYPDTLSRIKTNFRYFLMNYVMIVLIILFLSLLWHPISLIVFVALMAAWLFLYFLRDDQLVIFHHPVDDRVVMAVLSVVTIVLLLLTGATMNILCSILVGVAVVVVHAAVRKTDDLCLDEDGGEAGGFLAVSSPVE
ncbi:putative prenylated rab acceptor P [Helianthus annuus]|uniref:PRA1 family protein n=1 Tax=Helianthus annuus TaxID=4232 RepID=A0A251VPC2_HELAN|nr:PRA1 family protein F3 [Helianthus annuus]KAF5816873.1 putative prenylated rab acceptor PRA1 [Helianthus annuus]KAJ0603427.1 putative prenylated rab acceptor P [Helianthus annuus]KAJ0613475.1 putative prenylated rab acceptor P [Helianthus annuus]KAJ0617340.1 putative prenylated rab acceptor P [Helianthus annuus]KAJ0785138.1 putative prenylated rab acceptor P [Helianthus annuus]